jgi:ParB/RepB/Spo0J family partition protein
MAAAGEEADATEAVDAVPRAEEPSLCVPWNRLEIEAGHNPRTDFNNIEELTASVAEQGVVVPLTVRPHAKKPGFYIVTAGERRWRAVLRLIQKGTFREDHPVPVHLRDDIGATALLAALVENIQRESLAPLEEAKAFEKLRGEPYKLSAAEIGRAVGKTRRHVQYRLQLLRLGDEAHQALAEHEISYAVARALASAPVALQRDVLKQLRTSHNESFRTEEGVRRYIQSRAIPFERALFEPTAYTRRKGAVYEGEAGHKYFLDPDLFLQLQEDALENLKISLRKQREWVEVIAAWKLPNDFRRDPAGPGAVILAPNSFDIEVIDGVSPAAPKTPSAPSSPGSEPTPAQPTARPARLPSESEPSPASTPGAQVDVPPTRQPAPAPPEPPRFFKTPTRRRNARAAGHRNRALQDAILQSPDTALRLAIASMLAGSSSVGVRLQRPPYDQRPPLAPAIESALASLAGFLGVGSTAGDLLDVPDYQWNELEIYQCLLTAAQPQLERMHRALLATSVGAWYPSAQDARPDTPPLLVRVATDLDVEVTDWSPTAEYFAEYTTAELRAIGEPLGIELPKTATKAALIDALLESGKLNRYVPPELSFRTSAS